MLYIDTDILKAEQRYRQDRIKREFRAANRAHGSDHQKPVKHRPRWQPRHAA